MVSGKIICYSKDEAKLSELIKDGIIHFTQKYHAEISY